MGRIQISWLIVSLLIILSFNFGSALQCYNCNSTSEADCSVNPASLLDSVECPNKDDICVMAVLDDMVTYRGCSSQVDIPEDCEYCMSATCTDDLCNGGIYPQDRLKCHRCQREECINVTEAPLPCRNYDRADYCYVDVIDETDVIRGCVSDDDYDAGVYTVFCKTDGCNNVPAVTQFSCLSCDSDKDENCKIGDTTELICKVNVTDVCTMDLLSGRRESCFTYHDGQRVVRGCSRFNPELIMQTQYITLCRDKNCNAACVKNPTCYVCDSNDDPNCYNEQTALTPQDCPIETSSCFTCKHEDDSITRGCQNASTLQGVCQSCSITRGCNVHEIQACYQCDSETNENCATWHAFETIDFEVCPNSCITKVTEDGQTLRGCKTNENQCSASDPSCKECNDVSCNGGTFPKNRTLCFQCGENDLFCDHLQYAKAYACPLYDISEECYQFMNDAGKMIRGCKSDERFNECQDQGDKCSLCSGSECNSVPVLKQNTLSCIVCEDNKECPWAQLTSKQCEAYIPFNEEPACFTQVLPDNSVARGCLGDPNACDPAKDKFCENCNDAGCNHFNKIYQSCVQCVSQNGQDDCAISPNGMEATKCSNDIQFYDKRGCYVMNYDNQVTRGCVNDLDEVTWKKCLKDDEPCEICLDQGCNHQRAPSSSSGLASISLAYIVTIAFIIGYE